MITPPAAFWRGNRRGWDDDPRVGLGGGDERRFDQDAVELVGAKVEAADRADSAVFAITLSQEFVDG